MQTNGYVPGTGPKILIVEDELVVALDLSKTLTDLGYHVVGVADRGSEAIAMAKEFGPHLAIMDIVLPGSIDGVAAAKRIQAEQQIPIIFLTAHQDEATVLRATQSGAFGHLTKPVRTSELNAAILIAFNQHRLRGELLGQKTWLTTLLGTIGEAVIATDGAGRVEFMNAKAEALTGCSFAGARGSPIEAVYNPVSLNGQPLAEPRVRTSLRTGLALPREQFLIGTGSGRERPVEESVSPLFVSGGLAGSVAVFRDMSDQLRLAQAQKFETIGVLAGGVAHDFNNLLTSIIGNASLAADTAGLESSVRANLDTVLESAAIAAELTKQLLAYAGRGAFTKANVSLSEVVKEIDSLIRTTIPGRVRLSLNLQPDIFGMEADKSQIQQVIMNLVINACEALRDEFGLIEISTGTNMDASAENGGSRPGQVFLRVRDTGHGMDAVTQARIFDPFFTTNFTGRGLGLAAVQGIVRAHGGSIELTSIPDQGTTFVVSFPAIGAGVKAAPTAPRPEVLRGDETVLVVDDVESVRMFAKAALEKTGYSVIVADGGQSALDLAAKHKGEIDLVLLDLSMPLMSGDETARLLAAMYPGLRICMMSGYSESVAGERLHGRFAASSFLQKPFSPQELRAKVRETLDRVA